MNNISGTEQAIQKSVTCIWSFIKVASKLNGKKIVFLNMLLVEVDLIHILHIFLTLYIKIR